MGAAPCQELPVSHVHIAQHKSLAAYGGINHKQNHGLSGVFHVYEADGTIGIKIKPFLQCRKDGSTGVAAFGPRRRPDDKGRVDDYRVEPLRDAAPYFHLTFVLSNGVTRLAG